MMELNSVDANYESLLVPLGNDSSWCPQNIDKVNELLSKIKRPTENQKQAEEKQNFYRQMLKPYCTELMDSDDVIFDQIQLVSATDFYEKSSKIAKVSLPSCQEDENDMPEPTSRIIQNEVIKSQNNKIDSLKEENGIAKIIIEAAENLQNLQDIGEKIIYYFSAIENDLEKLLVCSNIASSITKEKLNNIILFLSTIMNEKKIGILRIFVENVIFNSLSKQDLAEHPLSLPLLIDILALDEEFVTKKFLVTYISKCETLITNALPFLSKLATQLQKVDHKIIVLSAYLKSKKQSLCDESQLVFLDSMLISSDFDGLSEIIILQQLTSYLFDSMQNNDKSVKNFNKNMKLGKFLLNLVKNLPDEIPPVIYMKLSQAIDLHQSFLKKSIITELRKKVK